MYRPIGQVRAPIGYNNVAEESASYFPSTLAVLRNTAAGVALPPK